MKNLNAETVNGFGDEWSRFDQSGAPEQELSGMFYRYFNIFPFEIITQQSKGFDLGCGSGRWARLFADNVGELHCIEASEKALEVAKRNLSEKDNCVFHLASVDEMPLEDNSMDFGYSLGVLHHVPDTFEGIKACVSKLKRGAPLLLYIYYAFDNRPPWFAKLWKCTELFRSIISRLPYGLRYWITQLIALTVYYPLAKSALLLEKIGFTVDSFPLAGYRKISFYSMRTDALDRFGTQLERRFTASEIKEMMERAGLSMIKFSDSAPYWCAIGYKK
ncbi:class I SAM-dependent methyltransferase [Geobacter hydrogenophilus]|uniref:class I SAM-dependent methyltransferase n=1 Tax=Geobacter hydrogenophilus TaxID=40983 RepID=UPI001BD99240|nr:class I SAM-dependent methyltransferase [Geobacter hydrogenophilus]MBT0894450.1 class I SAM-dependent methyltransferase [Geobacter hydrogenophilus]